MTAWLVKRFIHNPHDTANQKVRGAYGTLGSLTGVAINVLLAALKFVLGTLTGSLAVTADAVNNLSDAGGSLVSFISVRVAQKPFDNEHPFGHGRMEYIGALAVGAIIVLMGVQLLKDGVAAILSPEPLTLSALTIVLLLASILCKLWLFFFYRKLGRAIDSATLLAASKDSVSDVIATSAVLASIVLQAAFGWQIDGYMGVVVALFVLRAGVSVCKDTVDRLLGGKPDPAKIKEIRERLMSYPGILGVHDLVLHDYGPGRCVASVHAEVSAKSDIVEAHEQVDQAEREVSRAMGIVLCIHMDPIVTDDEQTNEAKAKVLEFLKGIDERLTLHDFRIVPGQLKINLVFDCLVPADCKERAELPMLLRAYAQTLDPRYDVIVQLDTDFT